jgi:hypothetical protein
MPYKQMLKSQKFWTVAEQFVLLDAWTGNIRLTPIPLPGSKGRMAGGPFLVQHAVWYHLMPSATAILKM